MVRFSHQISLQLFQVFKYRVGGIKKRRNNVDDCESEYKIFKTAGLRSISAAINIGKSVPTSSLGVVCELSE
jgi:hypothetical protein